MNIFKYFYIPDSISGKNAYTYNVTIFILLTSTSSV